MPLKEDHIESIIIRFLQGNADSREVDALRDWINKDNSNLQMFHQMQDLWNSLEVDQRVTHDVVSEKWQEFMGMIDVVPSIPPVLAEKYNQVFGFNFLKIAAVFVFGFFVSYITMHFLNNNQGSEFNEIFTPMGAKSEILLPDGTKVWLNAGSTLKYPAVFNSSHREVFLKGEAYFSVSGNEKKRFTVNTEDLIVTVYGTEFNIKSYPEDKTSETTLVEGSISVTRKNPRSNKSTKEILLQPNQRLVMYKKSNNPNPVDSKRKKTQNRDIHSKPVERLIISKGINPQEFVSWRNGTLTISNESMEEFAKKIERRFNVNIIFNNEEIKKLTYSGIITNETLEQVMLAIQLASPVDYKIDKGIVILSMNSQVDNKY